MRVLITGVSGFLGKYLAESLLSRNGLGAPFEPLRELTVTARRNVPLTADPRLKFVSGDFRDASVRAAAIGEGVDVVFHMAGALIAVTESHYEEGRSINLDATLAFFEELRSLNTRPRVVFASTIGVYGKPLPDPVTDDTPAAPELTYGTHKLIAELQIADLSRRGFLDGRSVRIAGTLPRPRLPDRTFSPVFGSNIFHALLNGEPFDSPVSPDATLWAISRRMCIENLVQSARAETSLLPSSRVWLMPALFVTMGEVHREIVRRLGEDRAGLVNWNPDPAIEKSLGSFPRLRTASAERLGLRHDGDLGTLVTRVLDDLRMGMI
jgi:nucleoside-diphosphate-sugar epimerase